MSFHIILSTDKSQEEAHKCQYQDKKKSISEVIDLFHITSDQYDEFNY